MSDIKLFRIGSESVQELSGSSVALEKSLQALIEHHLEAFLGVRFLASEYSTGKTHGGRIDTLGMDENHSPVIIEYKRSLNENVINQGLFYLDWLRRLFAPTLTARPTSFDDPMMIATRGAGIDEPARD